MRVRDPLSAVALAAVLAVTPVAAEPLGSHFQITPFGGFTMFDPEVKPTGTGSLRDAVYTGARIGWQFKPKWCVELAGGVTPSSVEADNTDVTFVHGSGNLVFTPMSRRGGGPFLSVGGGAARFKPSGGTNLDQGTLDLAGGVRLWLTDAVGLRFEARDIHYLPKYSTQKSADYFVVGAGLTLALGATPRDTDGDGVPDKNDRCPDTPKGARVDASGCPIDTDGDQVFDGLDQCEGTPKGCTVDPRGCPADSDGDGVCDGVDTCPDTPKGATVDATGCPRDEDGDKVLDGLDKCAATPVGCSVDSVGCPRDSDSDGVCDGLDKCPDTAPDLKVDRDGCPIELIERETELLDTGMIRLQDVNFETNKAVILPESHGILDIVGQVLSKWPELRIEVGGHTDSRGSDAHNRRLSQARADAVLTYVKGRFPALKPEQYSAKGYGESKALVPNTGELNWAKNRRVEFVVLNKDVLRREVERRRLLRRDESAPADTTRR